MVNCVDSKKTNRHIYILEYVLDTYINFTHFMIYYNLCGHFQSTNKQKDATSNKIIRYEYDMWWPKNYSSQRADDVGKVEKLFNVAWNI